MFWLVNFQTMFWQVGHEKFLFSHREACCFHNPKFKMKPRSPFAALPACCTVSAFVGVAWRTVGFLSIVSFFFNLKLRLFFNIFIVTKIIYAPSRRFEWYGKKHKEDTVKKNRPQSSATHKCSYSCCVSFLFLHSYIFFHIWSILNVYFGSCFYLHCFICLFNFI